MAAFLIASSVVCTGLSIAAERRGGETRELLLPPFRFVFGPGVNWAFAGLVLALLALAAKLA